MYVIGLPAVVATMYVAVHVLHNTSSCYSEGAYPVWGGHVHVHVNDAGKCHVYSSQPLCQRALCAVG